MVTDNVCYVFMYPMYPAPQAQWVLKDVKRHSEDYYFKAREKIYDRLAELPRGTIKERLISGRKYYYLQRREGKKVVHTYLGKAIHADLKKQMRERKALSSELEKIQSVLLKFVAARIKTIV